MSENVCTTLCQGLCPGHFYQTLLLLETVGEGNKHTKNIRKFFFKNKYITNPTSTPEDAIMAAAENLASALKGKIPLHLQKSSIQALSRLQDIFNQTASPPPPTQPTINPVPRVLPIFITQEIYNTEVQEDHTPSPPAHPPDQRPAPPPRV